MKRYLDAIHFLTLKYNVDVLSIQQFLTKEDNVYLANKLIDEVEVIMDNMVKEGLKSNFDKDYKDYEIVVTGVKVIGDKTYKGTVEFLYEGKPYIQPVIIKSTDKEYSYEFKFNPYVIKEEAEKATLKLIEENLLKADKKKFKIKWNL